MHQSSNQLRLNQDGKIFVGYQLPNPPADPQTLLESPSYSDIFVAYTDEEECSVRVLESLLELEGIRTWVGDLEVLLSPVSTEILNQGIQECDALLLMIGGDRGIPYELQDELAQGLKLNKLIFLITRQPCDPLEMSRLGLQNLHWVPVSLTQRKPSTTLAKFVFDILIYTRLQNRTFAWQQNDKKNVWLLSEGDLEKTQTRVDRIQSHRELGLTLTEEQSEFLKRSQIQIHTEGKSLYFHGKSPDLFISYSRKDKTFVKQLAKDLEAENFILWLDWENIPVAANWRSEVEEGIRESHTFVFVISADSVNSEPCLWELQQARKSGCRIIPIVCRHDYQEELTRINLSDFNYVSFERNSYSEALEKLVQAIRTDFQDVKKYNKFYSDAYEWHLNNRPKRLLLTAKEYRWVQTWIKRRSRKDIAAEHLPLHPLQIEYLNDSKVALSRERQARLFMWSGIAGACSVLLMAAVFARLAEIKALVASLEDKAGLDSLITALRAGQKLENRPYLELLQPDLRLRATTALHQETMSVRELNRLEGHERTVFDVEFSPDGQRIISVGEDQTVRIWSFAKAIAGPMKRHSDRIVDVAHSSDGDFFVTGSYDGVVNLWSCKTLSNEQPTASQTQFSETWETIAFGLESFGLVAPTTVSQDESCQWVNALPEPHKDRIVRVRISPGSQFIASASFDGNVHLWERNQEYVATAKKTNNDFHVLQARGLTAFKAPRQLSHEGKPVFALDFNPRQRHLVSADVSGAVKLWSLETGEEIDSINVDNIVLDVQFSRDGKYVAIGGADGLLKIWDWQNNQVGTLPGHVQLTKDVVFHPHDNRLASADTDGNIQIWYPQDLQKALQNSADAAAPNLNPLALRGHQDAILNIQFSPDGNYLASASADDSIRLWLTADGALLDEIEGHQDEVVGLTFSPLLKEDPYNDTEVGVTYLASASRDGTVRIWRINNDVRPLPHQERVFDVAFHPDGQVLASAGRQTISLWRIRDHTRIAYMQAITPPERGDIFSVHYHPTGNYLVAGDSTGNLTLWQPGIETNRPIHKWAHNSPHNETAKPSEPSEVLVVRFSPEGDSIVSGGNDGVVRFWNLEGKSLGKYSIGGDVTNLSFSPDGQTLVIVSKPTVNDEETESVDGKIAIYQVDASQEYIGLDFLTEASPPDEIPTGGVMTVTFNPKYPDQFATGDTEGSVKLWKIDGTLLKNLREHTDAVTRVDYSPDGELLASSSRDTTVKLWRAASGELVSSLQGHDRQVTKVVFDPKDATMLASAGFDDKVLIWEIPPHLNRNPLQKLAYVGCSSVKDYLKLEEEAPSNQNFYKTVWIYFQDVAQNIGQLLNRNINGSTAEEQRLQNDLEAVKKYCLQKEVEQQADTQ